MDGYIESPTSNNELLETQTRLNNAIYETFDEIRSLRKLPSDINNWISSINLSPSKVFKLSDLTKMRKINKKIHSLMEQQEVNSQKLKELAIDELLIKINTILEEK